MSEKVILKKTDIDRIILDTAAKSMEEVRNLADLAIVGVPTRAVDLANRLKAELE